MTKFLLRRLLPAAIVLLSGTAPVAQDPPRAPRVFHATADGLVPVTTAPLWFGFVDRGERYTLELVGDLAAARRGDTPLPESRVRRVGAEVQVLDETGSVMAQVRRTATGGVLETFPDRSRPSLGVRLLPVPAAVAAAAGRDAAGLRLVAAVVPGMGAAAAGVRAGDLLCEVAGGDVGEARLRQVLAERRVGDAVVVKVLRDGGEATFTVLLQSSAAPTAGAEPRRAVEFRDGMLFVLDPPGGGPGGDVARELQALRERMQRMEAALQEALAKAGEKRD